MEPGQNKTAESNFDHTESGGYELISKPKRKPKLSILVVILLGLGIVAGVYVVESTKAAQISDKNKELVTQVSVLQKQIQQQKDINNGVVSSEDGYEDTEGKLGLLDGAITFTMPDGWSRVPARECLGGVRWSEVLCYEIAGIAPDSFIGEDGKSLWSAEVAVYQYEESDGSAQDWYETKYTDTPLEGHITPSAEDISTNNINGNKALNFSEVDSNRTEAVFVVVRNKYAVLMEVELKDSSGEETYDYRDTYGPALEKFFESIEFKE